MADKTFEKCPKCRVTNLMEAKVCRNCKTPLPWASGAAGASFDSLVAGAPSSTTATSASTTSASTTSASTTSVSATTARTPYGATNAVSSAAPNVAQDPNKPPQIYQGPPPTRGGYEEDKPKANPAPMYAGGIVAALLALFFVMRLISPAPAQPMKDMTLHTTKSEVFSCQAPSNWEVETGARSDGMTGSSLWTSGSAKVLIAEDVGGSLMSEGSPPPGKTKVQALHDQGEITALEKFANYEAEPSRRIETGFGETWVNEFTANGGFRVGEVRGIRATTLTTQKRIKFTATARVQDWDKLKSSFEQMLMSLGPPGATPTASMPMTTTPPTQ